MNQEPASENHIDDSRSPGDGACGRRTGEKTGWTLGWLGGFLWLLILAIVRLVQGNTGTGLAGLVLFAVAVSAILILAPWRHPSTRQWKLMVPVYVLFFGSIAWMVWTSGGWKQLGLSWWSFFWVLPCMLPLWTVGGKRWEDRND